MQPVWLQFIFYLMLHGKAVVICLFYRLCANNVTIS
nr:MAG TPA: hypothetical protein [Caudoviricetes sp.]